MITYTARQQPKVQERNGTRMRPRRGGNEEAEIWLHVVAKMNVQSISRGSVPILICFWAGIYIDGSSENSPWPTVLLTDGP